MARTTDALVRGIVRVKAGVDLTPFINTASMLVTALCTYIPDSTRTPPVVAYTDGAPDTQMELIERWLAAHFYSAFDAQLTSAKAGTVSVGYQSQIDLGLKASVWGQQAMLLDFQGNLAAWDNSAKTRRKVKIDIGHLGGCGRGWYQCPMP